jgi:hypothetical protein
MLDQVSNRRFLVDTGASYSILPHRSSLPVSGPQLYGPAGQPIPCWGDRLVTLQFQDQDFSWKFLLTDVAFPILGVDFLRAHKLLIDPEGHALLDSKGRRLAGQLLRSLPTTTVVIGFVQPYKPVAGSSSPSAHAAGAASAGAASAGAASAEQPAPEQPAPAASAGAASAGAASAGAASARAASAGAASDGAASAGPVSAARERAASAAADVKLPSRLSAATLIAARPAGNLLGEFPAVLCDSKRLPPVSHDVVHHIVTHGPPIASKFRKLDGEKLAAAKAEFKQLEEADIIQRSTSP